MMTPPRQVLIVAGESSGDQYGALLVETLRSLSPGLEFFGIGGRAMERSGIRLLYSSTQLAVVGITEVIGKFRSIWDAWHRVKASVKGSKPDVAVLIDYPGFNLRLAKVLHALGIPVLYYVSPQVWAWHSGRIKTIAETVSKMAVVLPFEEAFYREHGVDAEFVGHPLLEILDIDLTKADARRHLGVADEYLVIGLLPGSREREVRTLMEPIVGAAEILRDEFGPCRFLLPVASTVDRRLVERYVEQSTLSVDLVDERAFSVMKAADILLVASGTATLEAAIANVPMVIVYKVSPLSYIIGRMIVKVRSIGLANILSGGMVVPELIQGDANARRIAQEAGVILRDSARKEEITRQFSLVREKLGSKGASRRVAELALEMMGRA